MITIWELVPCCRCQKPALALEKQPHPLCEQCQINFETWLQDEINKMDNITRERKTK